jgi:hypothetical protein
MATLARVDAKPGRPFTPDRYERVLAIASMILLAAALIAVAKGYR